MSTSSHTPEPWFICTTEPAEIRTHPYLGSTIGHTIPNAHNAHRIVAAVNAVAGMPDPAAEIEAMRAEREEMRKALETFWEALPERLRQEEENKAMREAIREAAHAMDNLIIAKRGGMQPANALIDAMTYAKEALAKLAPFLP